jgi:UDP-N-acetylglucosamine--N-acetylmuramyl-(pentapeptide) pyrophosphoryl-undecaprenol N-acetylglucosamine transferase
MRNARTLEARGAAVVVADADCVVTRLDPLLRGLLTDGDRLATMGHAAHDLARSDAAQRLADFVEECARG